MRRQQAGGQADLFRDFGHGEGGVTLDEVEDFCVDGVEFNGHVLLSLVEFVDQSCRDDARLRTEWQILPAGLSNIFAETISPSRAPDLKHGTPVSGGISLDDKYLLESGRAFMTGIHALVRLPLDRKRLDRKSGLNTAGFISGYRGSPLGDTTSRFGLSTS